jgi:hypothetical protein
LLWLAGLAVVIGALLLTDRLLWQPGLTEDNVRRIRPGDDLGGRRGLGPMQFITPGPEDDGSTLYRGRGRAGDALAWTDDRGRVQQIFWSPSPAARRSCRARLRSWLGW